MKNYICSSVQKTFFLFLFLLSTNLSFGIDLFNRPQKISANVKEANPLVEDYTRLYDNGLIEIRGQTMLGKKIGIWYFYHESGKIAEEHLYLDGESDFNVKLYDDEGVITSSGKVLNGKQEGEWSFYDEKGLVLVKMTFKKGIREGVFVAYSETGAPIVAGVFKNNDLIEIDSIK